MNQGYYDPHPLLSLERPLALVGHPGSGVAHVARVISGRTGLPFNDVPRSAEAQAGRSRSQVLLENGIDTLREYEGVALDAALRRQPFGVIAFESPLLADALLLERLRRQARLVYLRRPEEELLRRIHAQREADPGSLPDFLVAAPADLASLRDHLASAEKRLAALDVVFEAGEEHASLVAEKICTSLDRLLHVERFSS